MNILSVTGVYEQTTMRVKRRGKTVSRVWALFILELLGLNTTVDTHINIWWEAKLNQ